MTLPFRVYTLIRKRVAQRIILLKFWIKINIIHKGDLLMKMIFLVIFITIFLLIILYFVGMSLFWNQP